MSRVDIAQWPADMNWSPSPEMMLVPLTWLVTHREYLEPVKESEPGTNVIYYLTEELEAVLEACEHKNHTHRPQGEAICNDCWREAPHA